MKSAILAIDQGTTGTRAIIYRHDGCVISSSYEEFPQYYPKPGWVEHDAEEIWLSVLSVIKRVLLPGHRLVTKLAALGITNQRETIVVWDKQTGKPVAPAIVWQDRRTSAFCDALLKRGCEPAVRFKTGLVIDPYFSATKIRWLLKENTALRRKAERGAILFGTIDTWLLWKLTEGRVHATDFTNASRTLLFNIHSKTWDHQLLQLFEVPKQILPSVNNSAADYGIISNRDTGLKGLPIKTLIGDQQAALYGQGCYSRGQAKSTYGTGCFAMMNLGKHIRMKAPYGLLLTLACDQMGKSCYALEGAVFVGGAVIQWLRDELRIFKKANETEAIALSVKDSNGVVFVPALTGLGSPYWKSNVRGMITGLTRGTTRAHLVRAALESVAQQTADILESMQKAGISVRELKVDGGAASNGFLMQIQADLLRIPIQVSDRTESTAWGAAKLAGLQAGLWKDPKTIDSKRKFKKFTPKMPAPAVAISRQKWKSEIKRLCADF